MNEYVAGFMVLLCLGFLIGVPIYEHFRGRCPSCKARHLSEIRDYEPDKYIRGYKVIGYECYECGCRKK